MSPPITAADDRARAAAVVVEAAWHDRPVGDVGGATLAQALELARRNQVEARLARAAADELMPELTRTQMAARQWRCNLTQSATLLRRAGIAPILIKSPPPEDCVYSNFDLVVGRRRWRDAQLALRCWAERKSAHPLEPDKVLLHPPSGPAAHLHRDVSWFGVVVVEASRLRPCCVEGAPWFVPAPADELRVILAHGLFQNLAVDLAELRRLRELLDVPTVADATGRAGEEGWGESFVETVELVRRAVDLLDRSLPPPLPLRLPLHLCAAVGLEHARTRLRQGARGEAARELALRPALIAAKRLRTALAGRR